MDSVKKRAQTKIYVAGKRKRADAAGDFSLEYKKAVNAALVAYGKPEKYETWYKR